MKRSTRTTAPLLALALVAGVTAPASAGPDRPDWQQAIESAIGAGATGVQLRLRDEHGEWTGSAGVRRLGEPAKPLTHGRFRIGSSTKTFTATLVLQLVAEGRLGLDQPVAGRLPEFGLDPRITTRMLLQNTSGLFNYTGEHYPDGTVVPGIPWSGKEWIDRRFHAYQPEELVRFALSKPPRFAPGTDWSYANTNFTVAVLLIEKITGRSYAEELQRRILRPLGLRDTLAPGDSSELPGPFAHVYYRYQDGGQWRTTDVTRVNPSWLPGAGDLISSSRDLQTFISALAKGKLLPAPLLAEMRTPHAKTPYGLGLFTPDLGPGCGGALLNHNGGFQGYGTMMYSTADGSRTLTAAVSYVDDAAQSRAPELNKVVLRLAEKAFCRQ